MIPDPLVAVLALTLGLLVGLWVGAGLGIRLAARRRAALGAHAQLARLWPAELPARSAADILAGVVRVVLGGRTYDLPVLPRAASRAWLESLDSRFAVLANELEAAGNDAPLIMSRLVAEADALYELLLSYDQQHVLPAREDIDAIATDTEILRAVLEVWRAVNPLAATVAEASVLTPTPSPEPRTSRPAPTAGAPTSSSESSPTSSSSGTSRPPRTASSDRRSPSSTGLSKPSGSAPSSPTTRSSTRAGELGTPRRRSTHGASAAPSSRPR